MKKIWLLISLLASGGFAQNIVDTATVLDTLTGLSTVVTGSIQCSKFGPLAAVTIPVMTGTSNATTATITRLPAGFRPTTAQIVSCVACVTNNGTVTNGQVSIATTGIMTLSFGASTVSATFTNTGTKAWPAVVTLGYRLRP